MIGDSDVVADLSDPSFPYSRMSVVYGLEIMSKLGIRIGQFGRRTYSYLAAASSHPTPSASPHVLQVLHRSQQSLQLGYPRWGTVDMIPWLTSKSLAARVSCTYLHGRVWISSPLWTLSATNWVTVRAARYLDQTPGAMNARDRRTGLWILKDTYCLHLRIWHCIATAQIK